jgi:Uma2 family endonuclease
MAEPAGFIRYVTLEEFDAMDFGDLRAELVDGLVVLNQSFPSTRHAQLAFRAGLALERRLEGKPGSPCRADIGSGLDIPASPGGLRRDSKLGPDLALRCRDGGSGPRLPVLVLEVLSPSDGAAEMMVKLRAYKSVPSIADIVCLHQDRMLATHHQRGPDGAWLAAEPEGPEAELRIPRLGLSVRLAEIYDALLDEEP